jgi:hypothetical protein
MEKRSRGELEKRRREAENSIRQLADQNINVPNMNCFVSPPNLYLYMELKIMREKWLKTKLKYLCALVSLWQKKIKKY